VVKQLQTLSPHVEPLDLHLGNLTPSNHPASLTLPNIILSADRNTIDALLNHADITHIRLFNKTSRDFIINDISDKDRTVK